MSVASALAAGQRAAEARMTSRATIWRKTGQTIPNEETGYDVPEWVAELVDLPCRIASVKGARTLSTPGGDMAVSTPEVHFPATTAGIVDGDHIEITEGERAGSAWRVVNADAFDQTTALRLPVVAVDRPGEWL